MKRIYLLLLCTVLISCSTNKKLSNSPTTEIKADQNNKVTYRNSDSEHVGSGTSEIIFNGKNNTLIFEHINSLFNSNESHVVFVIDGNNNTIQFTTKASVINTQSIMDTIKITGNYNSMEFIQEFVLENHSVSQHVEVIGNLSIEKHENFNTFEPLDSTEITNKITSYYEPAYEVIQYYKAAADSGNVEARYFLGEMYYKGLGTKKNYTTSKFYLFSAAQEGHVNSMHLLGHIYESVERDKDAALKWYNKAAEYGHSDAINRIEIIEATDAHN